MSLKRYNSRFLSNPYPHPTSPTTSNHCLRVVRKMHLSGALTCCTTKSPLTCPLYSVQLKWANYFDTFSSTGNMPKQLIMESWSTRDDVMTCNRFPHYWPFVGGIHRCRFPSQGAVIWIDGVLFDFRPKKLLNKLPSDRWCETPWRPCDVAVKKVLGNIFHAIACHRISWWRIIVCINNDWINDAIYAFQEPGPWFNIKMSSYQYRKSHCGDKIVLSP